MTRAVVPALCSRPWMMAMVQRREHFRFPLNARQSIRVGGHRLGKYFDGDLTLQVCVGRPVDLAHPAHADLGGDLIRAESCARGEGHVRRRL
jgi:hypothetical protein